MLELQWDGEGKLCSRLRNLLCHYNSTYIANIGFSTTSNTGVTSGTCAYTVPYVNGDICQLRLDFQTFVTAKTNPSSTTTDTFAAVGPTGSDPPTISGFNTGYHMYVETSRSTTSSVLTMTLGSTDTTTIRRWNVRVDQIECSNTLLAPTGCTQYFTGLSGTITSYSYQAGTTGLELTDQRMTICIRQGVSNCRIEYSSTTSTSFIVGAAIADSETTACAIGAVLIPQVITSGTYLFSCNMVFADDDGAATPGTVTQSAPFKLIYRTVATIAATGFSLNYVQRGCS